MTVTIPTWALLGSRASAAWHRAHPLKGIGRVGWVRYQTACGLQLVGRDVRIGDQPAGEPVCRGCEVTNAG